MKQLKFPPKNSDNKHMRKSLFQYKDITISEHFFGVIYRRIQLITKNMYSILVVAVSDIYILDSDIGLVNSINTYLSLEICCCGKVNFIPK